MSTLSRRESNELFSRATAAFRPLAVSKIERRFDNTTPVDRPRKIMSSSTRSQRSAQAARAFVTPAGSEGCVPVVTTERSREEARNVRNGVHPNGFELRTCICGNPNCRVMMKRLADINANEMLWYHLLPTQPKEITTENHRHIATYRKNVFLHIFGAATRGSKSSDAINKYNVNT